MNLHKLYKIMERQVHECSTPSPATGTGNYLECLLIMGQAHGAYTGVYLVEYWMKLPPHALPRSLCNKHFIHGMSTYLAAGSLFPGQLIQSSVTSGHCGQENFD
jgi:hypothetical protein